ncbi:SixA phosphatase family protein [Methylopila turkensis]|uniref:Phosphoglycerate mutase n=1 Tax=Methylopila turkensis TaxID=1437816 RepID=A0A9W6N7D5_9HYPH|nr:histidine phosphatase family protein [Methylopila turkensis]GLK81144.1 phosphoglycerate mutase [Methylopila turkensis]
MRRLILFRHAKSDWSSSVDDHDRGLAPRGRRAAGPMGAWLAGRGFRPDLVVCSTALRAARTWNLARAAFTPAPATELTDEIYEAGDRALLEVVRRTPQEVQTLMLVGHNPGLADLTERLAGSGDSEARRALSVKFPTAAIAVLDVPFDAWEAVAPGSARLDRFVTPKILGLDVD